MGWIQWLWGLAGWPYAFAVQTLGLPLPPIMDLVLRVLLLAGLAYLGVRAAKYVATEVRGWIQGRELEAPPEDRSVADDPHGPPVNRGAAADSAPGRKAPVSDEYEGAMTRFRKSKGRRREEE